MTESSESVKHLRTVLTQFTSDERSRFLRFVTGRKRPPAPFTVAKAGGDKDSLPHASTCASTLFLPDYSSSVIAKEKLRLAKRLFVHDTTGILLRHRHPKIVILECAGLLR